MYISCSGRLSKYWFMLKSGIWLVKTALLSELVWKSFTDILTKYYSISEDTLTWTAQICLGLCLNVCPTHWLLLKYLPSKVEFLILILPVAYLIDRKPLRQIVFLSCGLTTFGAFVKLFCWDRKSYWLLFIGQVSAIFGQVNNIFSI